MSGFAFREPRVMAAPNTFRSLLALVVLCGTTALPGTSIAQSAQKAPAKPTASTGPKDSILTPAQLQECVRHKERLHAQTDDALKDKAQIEADKAEIARTNTSLAEEVATIDRTSEEAVNAYNAKVEKRDQLIDAYEKRVTAYNAKAEQVKATKEGYEKSCENRRYDERDLNDIKRKK
jgi:hypothetical protein